MTRTLRLPFSLFTLAFAGGCTSEPASTPADASAESTLSSSTLPKPASGDPQVQKGWASVVKEGCAQCHQSADPEEGILSGQSARVPRSTAYGSNLTPDPDTGLDAWDAASIVRALRAGIDEEGHTLCSTMPRYSDMSDDESNSIAAYLQSLTAVHHDIPRSVCSPVAPLPDAGIDADSASDASLDVFDAEAGPCTPIVGEFSKCSYTVNLPCGGNYAQSECYLLLSDCATLCTFGAASCHYLTGCEAGTVTASPSDAVQIECFIPTSVICGSGVDL
jgi:mono/diheme cytochrome c family protein